jgi:nucleotide-binding universal stress UspA family protein
LNEGTFASNRSTKISIMKHILIALDYDPTAQQVAETGYALAKSMQAKITLLHVLADTAYYLPMDYSGVMGFSGLPPVDMMAPLQQEELMKTAVSFLDASKQHLNDPAIETMAVEGEFAESILSVAQDVAADVIVVGSHSRSALEKIIMGSVTEKLLHHSKIPLFIVPTRKSAH